MTKLLTRIVCLVMMMLLSAEIHAQYMMQGSATRDSCNCYTLTTEQMSLSGSVWESTKIDLRQSFDFTFRVFLGCRDAGADGMVFILQPAVTVGNVGQGLGFEGITPSIGIELDTYQNVPYDPVFDHISIQKNGEINHLQDLSGPIPVSSSNNNIEDCNWHLLRIVWTPGTDSLVAYFDGVYRVGAKTDLVKDVFNNDPLVHWGFSGGTGGEVNVQRFCTIMEPAYETGLPDKTICLENFVQFQNASASSLEVKGHSWNFGDGTLSDQKDPQHRYLKPGIYPVTYSFTTRDGCVSGAARQTITVGDIPTLSFRAFDTCETISPRLDIVSESAQGTVTGFKWEINGLPFSTEKNPDFTRLSPGNYVISLETLSEFGCQSPERSSRITIKPRPAVGFEAADGCVGQPVAFSSKELYNASVRDWIWRFNNERSSTEEKPMYPFHHTGNIPVTLTITADNGCVNTESRTIYINEAVADAGKDTIVLPDNLFRLAGTGGDSYSWRPTTGLSNPNIADPSGKLDNDQRYLLTVTTKEGCTDTSSVFVNVFKGSSIYVPNAFTPNGDGLNDHVKPYYTGIKKLYYFTIFDRWGKKVFSTSDPAAGWMPGTLGTGKATGTYVWVIKAEDIIGKKYDIRGVFTLIN